MIGIKRLTKSFHAFSSGWDCHESHGCARTEHDPGATRSTSHAMPTHTSSLESLADTHIKATEMALRPASNNRQIAGLVRENLLPVIQISRGYVLSVQGAPRAGF